MQHSLTRWTPTGNLVRDRFSRLFEDSFNDMLRPIEGRSPVRPWSPVVDIKETADGLSLAFELPGLTKADVEITVEDDVLTVSGERAFENEEKNGSYHRIERSYGKFTRSFNLGRSYRPEETVASFENGVLEISLPKEEESKPRQIAIE